MCTRVLRDLRRSQGSSAQRVSLLKQLRHRRLGVIVAGLLHDGFVETVRVSKETRIYKIPRQAAA